MTDGFERLVGEVEGVAAIEVDVVRCRREHELLDLADVALPDGRDQRPLGAVRAPRLDEPPIPPGQSFGRLPGRTEGRLREPRGMTADIVGEEAQRVDHRQRSVLDGQMRQQVGHAREDGHPAAPALGPVPVTELVGDAQDPIVAVGQFEQRLDRLRQHEREIVLEPVAESPFPPLGDRPWRTRLHEHVVTDDRHVERSAVVSPRVEGAAAGEIEAGVVPMTGHHAGLERALVEREAEVRAAVLDGVGFVVEPHRHDRQGADLADQLTLLAQLRRRSDPRALRHAILLWACGAAHVRKHLLL